MTNRDLEKLFSSLPKKPLPQADKEAVWSRIQNHIREGKFGVPQPVPQKEKSRGLIWLPKIAAATLATLLAVLAVNKAMDSLPGDALYSVKIASEKVEVALATNDNKKVEVLSSHAQNRLEEVTKLVQEKKGPYIVTKTLEALKNTTQEVAAISTAKPELADQVLELASQQEVVLKDVENQVEETELKAAVQKALSLSRETIIKLTEKPEGEEAIQGSSTDSATTTSTPSTTPQAKIKIKDGIIESQIQLGEIIRDETSSETEAPIILPEP